MVETRQSLQQLLAGLGEAARFESVGQVSAVLPGLEVKGIGSIGVPVAPADAKRIIGLANQAPYGLGEATVVDTDVRRVWQLEPSQFTLRNAAWSEAMMGVVDAVKRDLRRVLLIRVVGLHQIVQLQHHRVVRRAARLRDPERAKEQRASGRADLSAVARRTRHVPPEFISGGNDVSAAFHDYCRPLVGELPQLERL